MNGLLKYLSKALLMINASLTLHLYVFRDDVNILAALLRGAGTNERIVMRVVLI